MNKLILTALCAMAFASCNNHTPAEEKTTETTIEKTLPTGRQAAKINVKTADLATPKDVVCGMDLTDDLIEDTTSYEGKVYGFCNVGCKEEFLKNPTSYLTQK
ncbi:MAG TPA: YHS domain-containing protein [Chitinophagales bacterium]